MATVPMSQPQAASFGQAGMPVIGNNTGKANPATGSASGGGSVIPMGMTNNTAPALATPSSVVSGAVPGAVTAINSGTGVNGKSQDTLDTKQFTDIYGKGIGGLINNQVNNNTAVATAASNDLMGVIPGQINSTASALATDLSGTGLNSGIMQNYDASIAPTLAANQADLNTSLGNQGIGANSSTSALANADLIAQTQAQESGVAAQLTTTQVADTLALNQGTESTLANIQTNANQSVNNLLQGSQTDAEKETSASGWNVFGDVLGALGQDAATASGSIAKAFA